MADSSNQGKRKKKSKRFYGGGKRGKFEVIKAGMRGILVFGADNEAKARREAYNLLNEYADELFGSELEHIKNSDVQNKEIEKKEKKTVVDYQHGDGDKIIEYEDIESSSGNDEDVDDIEKSIAKEIKQIKSLKESRRFQEIATGVNAVLFIRTTLSKEDLNKLIHCILSDIAKTKQNKARSFQRLVPVTNICSADLKSINKIVSEHFLSDENTKGCVKSICVHYKSRFNSSLKRDDVIHEVSSLFLNFGHKVDLKNPDIVVVVEIMRGLCFMNMLNDFFRFKRYNLHQIANAQEDNAVYKETEKDKPGETGEDKPGETGEDKPGETGEDKSGETGEDKPGETGEDKPGEDKSGETGEDKPEETGEDTVKENVK